MRPSLSRFQLSTTLAFAVKIAQRPASSGRVYSDWVAADSMVATPVHAGSSLYLPYTTFPLFSCHGGFMAKPKGTGSTISIAGHPLHPMLVNFPITFLVTLVATDLAYLWTKQAFWAQVSYWLIIAAFVTGVVAALAGTLDFLLTPKIRKFVGSWMHFISGIIAVAVVGANLGWAWA